MEVNGKGGREDTYVCIRERIAPFPVGNCGRTKTHKRTLARTVSEIQPQSACLFRRRERWLAHQRTAEIYENELPTLTVNEKSLLILNETNIIAKYFWRAKLFFTHRADIMLHNSCTYPSKQKSQGRSRDQNKHLKAFWNVGPYFKHKSMNNWCLSMSK